MKSLKTPSFPAVRASQMINFLTILDSFIWTSPAADGSAGALARRRRNRNPRHQRRIRQRRSLQRGLDLLFLRDEAGMSLFRVQSTSENISCLLWSFTIQSFIYYTYNLYYVVHRWGFRDFHVDFPVDTSRKNCANIFSDKYDVIHEALIIVPSGINLTSENMSCLLSLWLSLSSDLLTSFFCL